MKVRRLSTHPLVKLFAGNPLHNPLLEVALWLLKGTVTTATVLPATWLIVGVGALPDAASGCGAVAMIIDTAASPLFVLCTADFGTGLTGVSYRKKEGG